MAANFSLDSLNNKAPSNKAFEAYLACEQQYKILNSYNKEIPSVQFSGDIIEKQADLQNKKLVTASDGKQYDLQDIIMGRYGNCVMSLLYKETEPKNIFTNILNRVSKNFCKFIIDKNIIKVGKLLDSETITNEIFYQVTGYEYTTENVDKFLKGEIKLVCEKMVEECMDEKLEIQMSAPYISKYYIDSKHFNELKLSRVELNKEEEKKYSEIETILDSEYRVKLKNALNNGQLLLNNSEDKSTVLDNLYKILLTKRADNLTSKQIIEECIEILDNPYIITQKGENIPEEYQDNCLEIIVANKTKYYQQINNLIKKQNKGNDTIAIDEDVIRQKTLDFDELNHRHLDTCAAASCEFDMAVNNTAEFFRMVERLTSESKAYKKTIVINEYIKNKLDLFNVPYEIKGSNAVVSISTDDNAYLLAEMQTKYKDEGERSIIDILAQSAFMNLGSGQTYESISDIHGINEQNKENSGLCAGQVDFVKEILNGGEFTITNTYMDIDLEGVVTHIYDKESVKNEILGALKRKGAVVAGFVFIDGENKGYGGHEITIIGYTTNLNGEGYFIVQDSDDYQAYPQAFPEQELIEMIHHASII